MEKYIINNELINKKAEEIKVLRDKLKELRKKHSE